MTTIAQGRAHPSAESWELPEERSLAMRWARPWLRNPAGLLGLLLVGLFFFLGIFGPWLAPFDPKELDATSRYLSPSWEHPFGTTKLGEDIFSRILVGARLSLMFGVMVMIFGFIPGTALGIASGYFGRWADYAIQRSGEAWAAIPQLPLLLTVIAAVRVESEFWWLPVPPGLLPVVIVLAISAIFGGSRLLRAIALLEKNKDYVFAAKSLGGGEWHVLRKHVLPNIMPFILIGASSVFAVAVLAEATLSFLGLGLEQGTPGWGIDLSAGREGATEYPHLVIFPGLAISLTVLGFTLLGDTLRDILDPRLKGTTH